MLEVGSNSKVGKRRRAGIAVGLLSCAMFLAGPVAGASANKNGIVAAIESYNSKILTDEGHIETALGAYEQSKNPGGLLASIKAEVSDLNSLHAAIKAQNASTPKIRRAKGKINKGIRLIATADENFAKAVESSSNPAEARTDAEKTINEVKRGHQDLVSGLKLLLNS
jgi:hypothetical protein